MSGAGHSPNEMQIEGERKLLAALCQATVDAETRAEIVRRLKHHNFVEPDHEIIFRALTGTPLADSADARQTLTQAVTRLGFPDVDIASLFSQRAPAPEEITTLLNFL
jgi:hypothetical protein